MYFFLAVQDERGPRKRENIIDSKEFMNNTYTLFLLQKVMIEKLGTTMGLRLVV